MRDDKVIWPTLTALADCLNEEFSEEGFCFVGVLPGATAVADYGDPGMAWVRLVDAFPSTAFPQPDQSVGCRKELAAQVEVGELHCAPQPDLMTGVPPSLEEQLEAARRQMAYMRAMQRAIECCLGARRDVESMLGSYTPLGPQGGLLGGTWDLWISEVD